MPMSDTNFINKIAVPDEIKGGYVPVKPAGGPPPGDPGLAQSQQATSGGQPQAQSTPQTVGVPQQTPSTP
jgi:hypothetical protein